MSIINNHLSRNSCSEICLQSKKNCFFKGSGTASSAKLPSGVFKQPRSASKNGMAVAIKFAELKGAELVGGS